MNNETAIQIFEEISKGYNLGAFKVVEKEIEADPDERWWDVGPLDKDGVLIETFFITSEEYVKWSKNGSTTATVYHLNMWVRHSGNREEPPSAEETCIKDTGSLWEALNTILVSNFQEAINDMVEDALHTAQPDEGHLEEEV